MEMINNEMYNALQEYLKKRLEMDINSPYLFVGKKTNSNEGFTLYLYYNILFIILAD